MPLALLALAALHFLGSNTSPAPVSKLELVRGLVSFQYQRDLIRLWGNAASTLFLMLIWKYVDAFRRKQGTSLLNTFGASSFSGN